jgi:protein TonB
MQYAQQQRHPAKHSIGFGIVVLIHVVVVYALVSGLARKVVDVIKQPLETKIIEAPKPPQEAPPPAPPPPKLEAPPPPFIPPPEVQIQVPVQAQPAPVIAVTQSVPPPVAPTPAPAAPKAAPVAVGIACPNSQKVRSQVAYPRAAQRQELTGDVLVEFVVTRDGRVGEATVLRSSHRVFEQVSLETVRLFKCVGQGQDVKVQVPFVFKLDR